MLVLDNLTTHYGSSQALFGVNMRLEAGQVATLLGRNGMGKTTTINSIMGIVKASGGSIKFDGQELVGRPSFKTANLGLGLVPEGRQIFPNLTMMENLVATASNHLGNPDPWTVEKVFALFPELETRVSSMGNLLSGGEQQMLAIGRALMAKPKLLLMDEPSMGLAPVIVEEIAQIIEAINAQGVPVVLVEQNAELALDLADYAYVLETGSLALEGPANELHDNEHVRAAYLGI